MKKQELLATAKPILFNTDMVRAILDDRKTVTRRAVKPHNKIKANKFEYTQGNGLWVEDGYIKDYSVSPCWVKIEDYIEKYYSCKPGDYLYVREAFAEVDNEIAYRADDEIPEGWHLTAWKPSIHMHKEAARIFLRVTGVRVERLQDITNDDCHKEGVDESGSANFGSHYSPQEYDFSIEKYQTLWDSLLPKNKNRFKCPEYAWGTNPWVWVIEFERVIVNE